MNLNYNLNTLRLLFKDLTPIYTQHVLSDQCMAIGKSASQRPYNVNDCIELKVEGEPVDQVSNFVYLGANISGDGTIEIDLEIRIQNANRSFNQLWKIWNSKSIRTPTKIRIYEAAVVTILLYWAEVWNTTKKQMKRFEVFHQTSLRRILRIRWYMCPMKKSLGVLASSRLKPSSVLPDYAGLVMYQECQIRDLRSSYSIMERGPEAGLKNAGGPVYWKMRLTLKVSKTLALTLYTPLLPTDWSGDA